MAIPKEFPESNMLLKKPHSMTDEECGSLPVCRHGTKYVSCWYMSWKERLSALINGKIWLQVFSSVAQPPVSIEVTKNIFTKNT